MYYASAVNLPVTGLSVKFISLTMTINTDGMVQYTNLCQLQEQEQQTFTKVYGTSTLGNSILSSGGILNVSGSGVFSSSVTANGFLTHKIGFCLQG
jgi:hypothetical protein